MAILIFIKVEDRDGSIRSLRFANAEDTRWGAAVVDATTSEIALLSASDERAEKFMFPRVVRAIEKRLEEEGDVPDEFWYAA